MQIYDYLVPHVYTPEISVLEVCTSIKVYSFFTPNTVPHNYRLRCELFFKELIKTITMNGAIDLYKRIWTDAVQFEVYDKQQIVYALLDGMALNRPPPTTPPSEAAVGLADVAWSVFQKAEQKLQIRTPLE